MQTLLEQYGKALIAVVTGSLMIGIMFLAFYGGEFGILRGGGAASTTPKSNSLINVMNKTSDGYANEEISINVINVPELSTAININEKNLLKLNNPKSLFTTKDNGIIEIIRVSDKNGEKVSATDCEYSNSQNSIVFKTPGNYTIKTLVKYKSTTITEIFNFVITH